MIKILLFLTLLYGNCINGRAEVRNLKLELVQVLFRHGARTPSLREAGILGITNASIYQPPSFYQLTNKGKNQAYILGRMLRGKYNEFLGDYKTERVQALTSNHDRTKMTLQLVLAGLYPPTNEERWNENLNWNPIPFSHSSSKCDALFEPYACPAFDKLRKSTLANSTDYQKRISKYANFLNLMTDKLGIPFHTDVGYYVGWTYTALECHRFMNLSLPNWHTGEVFKTFEELDVIGYDAMSLTEELRRLNGGTMVRRLVENVKSSDNKTEGVKLYLYSGHDLTVAAFIRAQKLDAFSIPPFGSAVIVEKLRDDQDFEYIRMLSWDGSSDSFVTVAIDDCDELCPMNRYLDIVKNVISSNEDLKFLSEQS